MAHMGSPYRWPTWAVSIDGPAPATKSVLELACEQNAAPATKSAPQVAKVLRLPLDLRFRLCLSVSLSPIYDLTLRKGCACHEICAPSCESAAPAMKSAFDLAWEQKACHEICTSGCQSAAPATRFAPPKQSARPCHWGTFPTPRDSVGLYLLILINSAKLSSYLVTPEVF